MRSPDFETSPEAGCRLAQVGGTTCSPGPASERVTATRKLEGIAQLTQTTGPHDWSMKVLGSPLRGSVIPLNAWTVDRADFLSYSLPLFLARDILPEPNDVTGVGENLSLKNLEIKMVEGGLGNL